MDNLKIYNALKQPPKEALRQIQGGRLQGKTDINPQWRYKAMTEQFGVVGIGWKYETVKLWNEPAGDGQIFAFASVNVYIKEGDVWSCPIPGCGGSMLVEKEKSGLHANDEGYKMAITDALSTAMKMIGIAADVYAGLWDGAKYKDETPEKPIEKPAEKPTEKPAELMSEAQGKKIFATAHEKKLTPEDAKDYIKKTFNKLSTKQLTKDEADKMIKYLVAIKPGESPLVRNVKEIGGQEI